MILVVGLLCLPRDDGGELIRIAEHNHLDPAKGCRSLSLCLPKPAVDRIEHISRHHRHFINDESVKSGEHRKGLFRDEPQLSFSNNPDRQAKKRVNRLSAGSQSGDSRGSTDRNSLCGGTHECLQKRRLARSRSPRDEHVVE